MAVPKTSPFAFLSSTSPQPIPGSNPGNIPYGTSPGGAGSAPKPTAGTHHNQNGDTGGNNPPPPPPPAPTGGGGGGDKKSNDKPMVDSLRRMLSTEFAKSRDVKLGNIMQSYKTADADILDSYGQKAISLGESRSDNEKAAGDMTWQTLMNRVREAGDILSQTALQGAGESDTLKSSEMANRNWEANQGDVNRSYFDTNTSISGSIRDLNSSTKTARINAVEQANSDREQTWANFQNQKTDAWTQIGNVNANPFSNQYGKQPKAYDYAATSTGQAWKSPGVPDNIKDWKGTIQPTAGRLNAGTVEGFSTDLAVKKPQGSTSRRK